MRSLFFFNLDYVVPPGLCSQSSWAACVLLGAPRLPWAAPEHGCFVLVNLQGCQFSRFLSVRAGRKVERAGKGAGGRRDAGKGKQGCCAQGTASPQCCERPAGDTAALLLRAARLGCTFPASLPARRKALLTCAPAVAS